MRNEQKLEKQQEDKNKRTHDTWPSVVQIRFSSGSRRAETLLRSTAGRLAAVSANINQAEWRLSVEIAMIINYFVSLIVIREVSNLFTMNQTDGIGAEQHPAAPEHCRDDFTHLEINLSFKARMILNISLQTPSPDSGLCPVSSTSLQQQWNHRAQSSL